MFNKNIKAVRFSSLQFFFGAAFAAYYPMLVVFLRSKGYSNTTIGTIVAVNSVIIIFAQPFWGIVSDWLQSIRKVFIICLSGAVLLAQTLPILESVLLTGMIFAVVTFFESPLNPLLDSWVIQSTRDEKNSYGSIRLWGSIGFAIFVFIYGKIIDLYSIDIIFVVFGIMGLVTIFISTRVKTNKPAFRLDFKDLKVGRLVKNYTYVTLIIFASILFIPQRSTFIFLPNIIESVSGSKGDLGLAYSVMALSEVPIFLLSVVLLKRFKPVHLICASSIFYILRQILYLIATQPLHIILAQLLQGPSVALFLSGMLYYINKISPDELKATSQTLATSIIFGISSILGSYGGGWVIDQFGFATLYKMSILISTGISVLFFISLYIGKTFKKECVSGVGKGDRD